ncbi:hypothetical protein TCAL_02619 [Tigriopus californicus]|uniref:Uncharacterized protein n=1 Tax=Tigriopus californicus TaxID=6832 RepID=A0A553NFS3_TIGCA|nr:uncharacterized protein LOC131888738 [Tigriopus californicus]TRY64296.1 hypothetical protein TCAL_02619 [Tigriopus californicus]|eukprot:TCALIF_02619-PA protein Name:"Protein of unknown function" AED:0.22 eAED:0.22 QI:79/1/0.66/1/0.5/0.66/3/0/185
MFFFKYWPVVVIPILYVGFYISLIYIKGDIVYRPYEDCNCMKEAAEKNPKSGQQKRPDQHLMEEINERNKRFFKYKSQIEQQSSHDYPMTNEENSQLKRSIHDPNSNPMEQFLVMSQEGQNTGERLYSAFKMPYLSLDHQTENHSSVMRRNCLKWSLVSGIISCTRWREPELVYHVIPTPPFGFL